MKLITDILREYRQGRAVDEASERLAELVRAVDETGKVGTLTIVLKVKPEAGGGTQKTIAAEIKMKKPEQPLPEAVFFSDEEGDLHRADPKQPELFGDAEGRREMAHA